MSIFKKILPLFILPILIILTELIFTNYLLNIVSIPNDIHLITVIGITYYMIGLGVGHLCTKVDKSS